EQKPEVRKAGGVYYTPKYIVEYIVEHTVGELCKGKVPRQIARMRILDPACGSGSFLLGAYEYLLNYHLDWYVEHPTKRQRPEIYEGRGGEWFLTTEEKKRILLNNVYGVDIDPQAVEVTKLSLLLKVLEAETRDSLGQQLELIRERALPDLASNIKCGNSLIGPDFYDGEQMSLLDAEEMYRINPFDWESEFPDVMKSGGFDVVIGNPPYIRIQRMKEWAPLEVEIYKERYLSARKGNYDIYVVFAERGLRLLNEQGRLGFILPHKFFNSKYGEPLRTMLAQGRHLAKVVHFGNQQVFEGATTYTCLLFLDKAGSQSCHFLKVSDLAAWRANQQSTEGTIRASRIAAREWNFVVGDGADLFYKLDDVKTKLKDVADRIMQGLVTGADPVFILRVIGDEGYYSEAIQQEVPLEEALLHPLCKGSLNIRRYHVSDVTRYILFPYRLVQGKAELLSAVDLREEYPVTWEYLKTNRRRLEERERGKWKHERWYAFGRSQNLSQMEQRKILTPSIANSASFTLDDDDWYYFVGSGGGGGGGYGITLKHGEFIAYQYLLGLLNSQLLDFYLKRVSTPFRGGYYAYSRQFIEQLPIRAIDSADPADVARHDKMVALVERMLALHKQLADAKTPRPRTPMAKELLQRQIDATDRQIDRLVYELYGLTEEEIGIVEEGS
ncbi:MAG: Eco57I restriction-modification methylase domain-containing protein, partial [Anaerolineae bacterium]|nr:Eco57I restriction-modification methylase domain-containing protein [Anaerolineae bacterium]